MKFFIQGESNIKTYRILAILIVITLILTACGNSAAPAVTPTATVEGPIIVVREQSIEAGTVVIDQARTTIGGWLAVYAQICEGPGPLLGYSALANGLSRNVVIEVDMLQATQTLHVRLHEDTGEVGRFEFPAADATIKVAGVPVASTFQVKNLSLPQNIAVPDAYTVLMGESCFLPSSITIPAGATIVWMEMGLLDHNAVAAEDGSFQSPLLRKGDSFEHTFSEPGVYPYYCALHGSRDGKGMAGTIIVTEK